MIETPVRAVMSGDVGTVAPDTPAFEAAERLVDRDIGSLVVVDGGIAGIVTESDFVGLVGERGPPNRPVADIMSAPVLTTTPDTAIEAAADRMREHGVKKLVVVEDGDLVGVVTTTDLAHHLPAHRVDVEG